MRWDEMRWDEMRWVPDHTLYALNIGLKDNGIGHLIFKLSTKQILTTIKYQPVPVSENLFKTINEMNSFTSMYQY